MMVTCELDGGQLPFVIVHWNTLAPGARLFTAVFAVVADTNVPLPETTLQVPVPTSAAFAPKRVLSAQICCGVPATEVLGTANRVMVT